MNILKIVYQYFLAFLNISSCIHKYYICLQLWDFCVHILSVIDERFEREQKGSLLHFILLDLVLATKWNDLVNFWSTKVRYFMLLVLIICKYWYVGYFQMLILSTIIQVTQSQRLNTLLVRYRTTFPDQLYMCHVVDRRLWKAMTHQMASLSPFC